MKTLILHPTETSQWHALLNEAQANTQLMLHEETESYLVFLLMRFTKQSELMASVLALDFLNALQKTGQQQVNVLQELGDKSLLFCGLFPDIIKRRHMSLNYFSNIGQVAYSRVGELHDNAMAALFFQLSDEFINLQTILQATRESYFNDKKPVFILNDKTENELQ